MTAIVTIATQIDDAVRSRGIELACDNCQAWLPPIATGVSKWDGLAALRIDCLDRPAGAHHDNRGGQGALSDIRYQHGDGRANDAI